MGSTRECPPRPTPSFHARAMGLHRTRGQHCTACAHDPAFIPCMRPSVPHLSRAMCASSRMRGDVCRVACERWGALGLGTRDDAQSRAHTPFPARVCDRGAVQKARAVTFGLNVLLDLSVQAATKTFSSLKTELLLEVLGQSTRIVAIWVIRGDGGVGDTPGVTF